MTIKIKITQGLKTIIDDEDKDLADIKWTHSGSGYAFRFLRASERPRGCPRKNISLHRVIMSRVLGRELDKSEFVDHINGDGLDNRRCNLRLATSAQNNFNKRIGRRNTSGYKGVSVRRPYSVAIVFNGKAYKLGSYNDLEEAARAYDKKAKELFGEFAELNFPDE